MSKSEYLIVPKRTKFAELGKLGLIMKNYNPHNTPFHSNKEKIKVFND